MADIPTGTVTFLFTDLEGSTRLWEEHPVEMHDALARHDTALRHAAEGHGGYVVKMTGDGMHAAFATAQEAIDAALDAQRALLRETWGDTGPLRVRMGLHTGASELRGGDYYGAAVNRAARLMAVAHGGQVVCSQATADLVRDDVDGSARLVDLGEHRLRDLGTPERVFQVGHADLPAEFPALRSLDAFPGNLPLQLSTFVGRDEELVAVCALLERERLVTVTGAGGVGKTRLAQQAAAAVLPHFADGAWFVDLAPVGEPEFVVAAIVGAMGLLETRTGNPEEALVRALAHHRSLLVLDNCEHIVDVAARITDLLVRRCPHVAVLATSQEALGVDGEATYALKPLLAADASSLFAERAALARHGFELTADNAATIDELCRRLDGIPLAIELAAARVASMSPAAVLERIDERFRLLAQGRRTVRSRHQTLRAAVDWSYRLLEPDEQVVFSRLSVFAGNFSLDAAEAVAGDGAIDRFDVLDLLAGLVAKSMVMLDDTGDRDYYRLLETLRDFGQQHLAERGELETLETRHADYYRVLAKAAFPHFLDADDADWLEHLTNEYANVRAALAFLRDEARETEYEDLAFALTRYWRRNASFREGYSWLRPALAIDETPSSMRAEALGAAGMMLGNMARYEEANTLLEQSLERSALTGEPPRLVTLMALAIAALVQNRPEDARQYGEAAVEAARDDGTPYYLGEALGHAGQMVALTVDDPRAIELADEAFAIAREVGSTYLSAFTTEAAGIARYRTDPARAVELLNESLEFSNAQLSGQGRFIKAVAHVTLHQYPEAARDLCVALPIMREQGAPYYESMVLSLGTAILARSQPGTAVRILALLDRMREESEFVGAPRDLDMQARLRDRLEQRFEASEFATLWAEGRGMSLDDAVAVALDELAVVGEGG